MEERDRERGVKAVGKGQKEGGENKLWKGR